MARGPEMESMIETTGNKKCCPCCTRVRALIRKPIFYLLQCSAGFIRHARIYNIGNMPDCVWEAHDPDRTRERLGSLGHWDVMGQKVDLIADHAVLRIFYRPADNS
jgi:hypothetical protein